MTDSALSAPLRIAFTGGYGHHLLRGALRDGGLRVEAVATASDGVDADAARQKLGELAGPDAWYDDPVAMLDRFKPTVVNVGGVYTRNVPVIVAALERGIPVVADKPIAGTEEDLASVARAAGAAPGGAALITEFNMRAWPSFRAAADAVARGEVGTVALATAQKSYRFGNRRPDFYRRREDYGSTLLWIASHAIDAIRYATGRRFAAVTGAHGNLTKPDYGSMEDHAAALLTLEGGGVAIAHADYLRPAAAATHGDDRLRIAGSAGVVEVCDQRCLLVTADAPPRDITDRFEDEPPHRPLLRAALAGERTLFGTEHSLELAAVLLAARTAADRRAWVELER